MAITERISGLNRRAQGLLGLLTIIAGFYMMWGSLSGRNDGESTLARAALEAVEIDSNKPSTMHIGKIVVAAGNLSSPELLEDEFLAPSHYLILKRKAEMYQWTEKPKSPSSAEVEYQMEWVEGQVDFLSFRQVEGHENPLLKYESKLLRVGSVTFGGFDGRRILDAISALPEVQLAPSMMKDQTLKIENNEIYLPRNPEAIRPSLGDIRISFRGLAAGNYTVAARQVDERSLVGDTSSEQIVVKSGKLTIDELFDDIANESQSTYTGLLYVGAFVLFFGVFSTLIRVAPGLDLRPKVELQGTAAVALIAFCVTLLTTILFLLLGMAK